MGLQTVIISIFNSVKNMNGIVIVDKPQEWTSQDVTARLRRVFNTRRIGHGGTLDPMATGVLPVFVGRGTRGVEFFEHAEKTYETVLRLGLSTDTEDVWGETLEQREVSFTEEKLQQVLEAFRGEILQVPPMYSALKVNGQKLCDLARKGKEVERQPRPITIHELTLLETTENTLRLRVRCSKGTYIRTLCKDIGEALGCGGCMQELRRVQAGEYTIAEAIPLKELVESQDPGKYLRDAGIEYVQPLQQYPDAAHKGTYSQSNDEVNRYIAGEIIEKIKNTKNDKAYDSNLVVTHNLDVSEMAKASKQIAGSKDSSYNDNMIIILINRW